MIQVVTHPHCHEPATKDVDYPELFRAIGTVQNIVNRVTESDVSITIEPKRCDWSRNDPRDTDFDYVTLRVHGSEDSYLTPVPRVFIEPRDGEESFFPGSYDTILERIARGFDDISKAWGNMATDVRKAARLVELVDDAEGGAQ